MRNNNLEIRIAGSSCRPEYGVWSLENEECGEKEQNEIKTKVGFSAFFYEKKAIHHFLFSAIYLIVQYW